MREAWRTRKHRLQGPDSLQLDLILIFVGQEEVPLPKLERATDHLIGALNQYLRSTGPAKKPH